MNTMKWYNLMNKAGLKSMGMFCDEESVITRLVSNLYEFAYDTWNESDSIDRDNAY